MREWIKRWFWWFWGVRLGGAGAIAAGLLLLDGIHWLVGITVAALWVSDELRDFGRAFEARIRGDS